MGETGKRKRGRVASQHHLIPLLSSLYLYKKTVELAQWSQTINYPIQAFCKDVQGNRLSLFQAND